MRIQGTNDEDHSTVFDIFRGDDGWRVHCGYDYGSLERIPGCLRNLGQGTPAFTSSGDQSHHGARQCPKGLAGEPCLCDLGIAPPNRGVSPEVPTDRQRLASIRSSNETILR